jgi:2-polyprenyl-3-methyl-5-hydroxy-6-metoxy-1,4-benzoquinol methylase
MNADAAGAVRSMDDVFDVLIEEKLYSSRKRLAFYLDALFDAIDLEGATMLDIGGGSGVFSFSAAARGASKAVCIEPESEGSTGGPHRQFQRVAARLGWGGRVTLEPKTFQEFDPGLERFDVVLLHDSINHLDEPASIGLLRSEANREIYRVLFRKIAAHMTPGGTLIEWHTHQEPETWASLLADAGFRYPSIRWSSFNRLYALGKALTANRTAAFFLQSHFRLVMRRV